MTLTHGFELIREQHVPEINSKACYFKHAKTGAELLSIENIDENKTFGITFKTPPTDSTGIAHIIEHSVLCGSRKYPVKEPFVELIKGSLATFLNAFTFPDKTMYPVASQNTQDFYNLIDVYLDAVFYPRITPDILKREGWHYELDKRDDPLRYKGVVFNEMKGAYSSPDSLLYKYTQQTLFPDNTYGVDSGGDPTEIPNLSYEQFKSFYQKYYHPSNSRIYFYGDDNPEERLRKLSIWLDDFESLAVEENIELQTPWQKPQCVIKVFGAGEDTDAKGMTSVSWMLTEPFDIERNFALAILEHILIGTAA
jgi:Zn-dependent M16 (insulinase) family peptidase